MNDAGFDPPPPSGWRQYASPTDAGFDPHRLELARRFADSVRSAAVMVVHRGLVVAAWGDVSRELELHSVRKSLVSALFGIAANKGEIDINRTLGSIGVSDLEPLTALERSARVRDLLAARSGVYLPAAYADAGQDSSRPARGSHPPDSYWFYNNWDFNALGDIYEHLVDSSLYQSLERRIARPIGMQDYTPASGHLVFEPSMSTHPAHTIRMSTRDLARFGELYRRNGRWGTQQVLPRDWVAESTRLRSDVGAGRGYGYLWWTLSQRAGDGQDPELRRRSVYYGSGTGGQLVLVIPSEELVIVHRGDTDHGRNVAGRDVFRMVELVLEAKTATAKPTTVPPRTTQLVPAPLSSQLPALAEPIYVTLDAALQSELAGNYEIAPGIVVKVFIYKGHLFGNFPGQGEAELFGLTRSRFTIRVQAGVQIDFTRDTGGIVNGFSAALGSQRFRGVKK